MKNVLLGVRHFTGGFEIRVRCMKLFWEFFSHKQMNWSSILFTLSGNFLKKDTKKTH